MTIGELIQNIATGGAVLLGITYVIGGLIVNLNLTRRGVVEYQILKVKYLAVGVIFILHFLGVVLFTFIPVVLIATFAGNAAVIQTVSQILSVPSILAALTLLYVWTRFPPNTKSPVGRWWFWFVLSVVATLYPLFVLLHQVLIPIFNLEWVFNTILAILTSALTIMAQIYHYSGFYYGKPAGPGMSDPIGMGIPTRVDLVCDEKLSPDLKELGLSVMKNIVHDVYLIDETNEHYLISQEQVPGGTGNNQTYKINKSLVRVILHKPDHMRRLAENSGSISKKRG
jgi:hypothetical protein